MNTETMNTEMNISEAFDAVEQGHCVARKEMNGKRMFIFQRPNFELEVAKLSQVQSIPGEAKVAIAAIMGENAKVVFPPYLCMFTPDGTIINGWVPSKADALAKDWMIVRYQ